MGRKLGKRTRSPRQKPGRKWELLIWRWEYEEPDLLPRIRTLTVSANSTRPSSVNRLRLQKEVRNEADGKSCHQQLRRPRAGATEAGMFAQEGAKVVFGYMLDEDGMKVEARPSKRKMLPWTHGLPSMTQASFTR